MAVNRSIVTAIARTMASRKRDQSRALPDSKGNEPAKQLQTYRTDIYSYFTVPGKESDLLYSAESWVKMKLTLETAGPVAIGNAAQITPVLSGHGILLDTGREYIITLSKGTRVYIASETVNRVSVTIEPIPWLEQIDKDNNEGHQQVSGTLVNVGKAIVDSISQLAGSLVTRSSTGRSIEDLPCPPPPPRLVPRLLTGARSIRKMR